MNNSIEALDDFHEKGVNEELNFSGQNIETVSPLSNLDYH